MKTKATTRPWLSGHCNPSNPAHIHLQCRGSAAGLTATLVCACACHLARAAEPTLTPVPASERIEQMFAEGSW
jgi:hypothetical protein